MASENPVSEASQSTARAVDPPASIPGRNRAWTAALVAGVVATGLTWGAGEASVGRFEPEATGHPERGPQHGFIAPEAAQRAERQDAALSYGLQGAILGLLLGLAGAAARGSARPTITAGLAGLALGGVLGAAVSYGVFGLVARLVGPGNQEMLPALLGHAAAWSAVGASGGIAFGLGLGGRTSAARAAFGGLAGATLAAVIYEVVGAMLFPIDKTADPISATATARLFAHALGDLLPTLGIAAAIATASPAPAPTRVAALGER